MYASRHLNRLSGEKGNTLVSQKRMQRYSIFFIYANILQKNMHFLTILTIFCNTNVANEGNKEEKESKIKGERCCWQKICGSQLRS